MKAPLEKLEAVATLRLYPNMAGAAGADSGCQFQAEHHFQACHGPHRFLRPPCFFTCFY